MIDVCNERVMRALLAEFGFHFSKAKGQNFLTDRRVPERIALEAGIDAGCGVVEIGPGFGPLTQELCKRAGKVLAVELDTTLRPVLARTVGEFENLELLFADAMQLDLAALVREKLDGLKPVACANLPYYITSPVLTKLLESRAFSQITVMVQKEVAERICAAPESRDYSAFSVFCQYYAEPKLLFEVPPEVFMPKPKVTSAVLSLSVRAEPPVQADEAALFRIVRAAFAQRRKTLLNSLSATLPGRSRAEWAELLLRCGIEPGVRGETLSLEEFSRIARES